MKTKISEIEYLFNTSYRTTSKDAKIVIHRGNKSCTYDYRLYYDVLLGQCWFRQGKYNIAVFTHQTLDGSYCAIDVF